jgi:hypothetical protein
MSTDYKYRLNKYTTKIKKLEKNTPVIKINDNTLFFDKLKKLYPSCIHDSEYIKKYNTDLKGNKVSTVYGEMNYDGIEKLYNELKKEYTFDSFIDIGSGYGKLVLYMAGIPEIKKSFGIEIVEERHKYAEDMKTKLSLSYQEYTDKITFFNKSMFDIDYRTLFSHSKKPLIWMSNLCFDKEITAKIINQFLKKCLKERLFHVQE